MWRGSRVGMKVECSADYDSARGAAWSQRPEDVSVDKTFASLPVRVRCLLRWLGGWSVGVQIQRTLAPTWSLEARVVVR